MKAQYSLRVHDGFLSVFQCLVFLDTTYEFDWGQDFTDYGGQERDPSMGAP